MHEIKLEKNGIYKRFNTQFESLKKLYLVTLKGVDSTNINSLHQLIAWSHLLWLSRQIKGIILLLNQALTLQAQQLIRALFEADINLRYIDQKPIERAEGFYQQQIKEAVKLEKELKKGNPFVPPALVKILQNSGSFHKVKNPEWNTKFSERAKTVNAEDEYGSWYCFYSWPVHLKSFVMLGQHRVNPDDIPSALEFDQISILLSHSRQKSLAIIKTINTLLQFLPQKEIDNLF